MTEPATTPLPVPAGPQAPAFIVVFGGTFDPPHRAHAELPSRVRDELERRAGVPGRAWLVYVPAARSPHKPGGPAAPDADRVEMLRLALADAAVPRAAVWTDEIDRAASARAAGEDPAPSYTVETLGRARAWLDAQRLDAVPLRLLTGADQALGFHRWRQPRDVLRLARPAVMVREDASTSGAGADADTLVDALAATGFWDARDLAMWRDAVVPVGRVDASATRVRRALALGLGRDAAALLTPSVAAFIAARALYRA